MKSYLEIEMTRIVNKLKEDQSPDGTWDYPFETGISTDAYMIILLRSLQIHDEKLIQELVERIVSRQEENGAWKLFFDEDDGNVSTTVEAYYSLLYSGYYTKNDENIQAAKRYVLSNGGIEKSHMFTKIMLALTGQIPWPMFFPIPIEIVLLPVSFPINFFDFSIFGRANLTPILILAEKKYCKKTKMSPDLSDLFVSRSDGWNEEYLTWSRSNEWMSILASIKNEIKTFMTLPEQIHSLAFDRAKKYMLDRIEPDGTFSNYFSSTFLMIFSLLSLGYKRKHAIIMNAVNGLKSMKCQINGLTHMQYTTATVWNSSLISYALQEAGVKDTDPTIVKANGFLLSRQHYKYGDWAIHNPDSFPGGWGFSYENTLHPDLDDTTASLRAIGKMVNKKPLFHQAWDRGIQWVFSMQNDDGGWPSFEKNVNKSISSFIPLQGSELLLEDSSSADLTGRTLEFFGNHTTLSNHHCAIKAGVKWLLDQQEKDGSWYGRWGICYIYGTWAAVTGLVSVGVSSSHPAIQKAIKWLRNIQNSDGGWGESCKSDIEKTYIPLGSSTLTHTAWAVDALIAATDAITPEIEAGIQFILTAANTDDWTNSYPKGQGMAGGFYMHYHSYRYIFPLLTLARYKKKFMDGNDPN